MATILDLPEIRERAHRWTVAEYLKLEDDPAFRHSELIRGIIIEKMPKSSLHENLTDKVAGYLRAEVVPGWWVRQKTSLQLKDSMPEPDVAVVRGKRDDYDARKPTTAELVVEAAVSSVAPDRENAVLYAEADVTEYWIVLGELKQIEVYRRPANGVYQEKRTYARGETIEGVSVTDEPVAVGTFFP